MKERWKQLDEFPNYSISNLGQVRTDKIRSYRPGRSKIGQIRIGTNDGSYRSICLVDRYGSRRNIRVHILVCTAFHGPKPTRRHEVAHWDGNGHNNKAKNLRWATRKSNHADKHRHGTARIQKGVSNVNARLTESSVKKIRRLHNVRRKTYKQLAKLFEMSPYTISGICRGKLWSHIPLEGSIR